MTTNAKTQFKITLNFENRFPSCTWQSSNINSRSHCRQTRTTIGLLLLHRDQALTRTAIHVFCQNNVYNEIILGYSPGTIELHFSVKGQGDKLQVFCIRSAMMKTPDSLNTSAKKKHQKTSLPFVVKAHGLGNVVRHGPPGSKDQKSRGIKHSDLKN